MKNKDIVFVLLLVATFCAASFIASAWHGRNSLAAIFLILAASFAAMGIIFHYHGSKVEGTAATPIPQHEQRSYVPQPVTRNRTYTEEVHARESYSSSAGTHASAIAAHGLENAGKLIGEGVIAFRGRPAFWTGVTFAVLAAISLFVGMTGIATTWKAMHAAGAFAVISAGFFIDAYQKWAEGKEFAAKHFAVIWLVLSVLGVLVTPLHKNWPMGAMLVGFVLSGIAALVTILEKWPETRAFLVTWLFKKGWVSGVIWVFLALAVMFSSISPTLTHNARVTRDMSSVMSFYAFGIIALGVVAFIAFWKKR